MELRTVVEVQDVMARMEGRMQLHALRDSEMAERDSK